MGKSCTYAVALHKEMASGASEGHLQCGMKSLCLPWNISVWYSVIQCQVAFAFLSLPLHECVTVLIAHWDIIGADFKKRCNLFAVFPKLLGMALLKSV